MNEQRLYLNGQQIDLMPDTPLAYTLQVNDIGSVQSRETNFTRNIDIPKTPRNMKIFEYLGVVGSDSTVPYKKNVADYYIGNECIIHQGWANITETTNVYRVHIYDGNIDFFKALENKTFGEIDLSELTHTKELPVVLNSWTADLPYRYVVADYGGKVRYGDDIINTDYLTPSVNVAWLWDKVFEQYNINYSGTVFSQPDFTNLFLSYPKGLTSEEDAEVMFNTEVVTFWPLVNNFTLIPSYVINKKKSVYVSFDEWDVFQMAGYASGSNFPIHLYVPQTANYRIELSGKLRAWREVNSTTFAPQKVRLYLCKNGNGGFGGADALTPFMSLGEQEIGGTTSGSSFSVSAVIPLAQGENFCIIARSSSTSTVASEYNLRQVETVEPITMTVSKINQTVISFDDALMDYSIRDFISEILWRFGLTIFKDKYSNSYEFLTLKERITNAQVIDWSSKYQRMESEKYVYGGYAQNNVMRYTYNDPLNNHHDGSIQIANANLEESKDIIKSKMFAPEKAQSVLLPVVSNIYPLWSKEVNETSDGETEVKYKSLDKRFYMLRENWQSFENCYIGSEQLGTATEVSNAPFESFSGLTFNDIIANYYEDLSNIIGRTKLITAKFNLTPKDIAEFDFKKLYHIDQLGGRFIINKVNNYQRGKLTTVELIKIEIPISAPSQEIFITKFDAVQNGEGQVTIMVDYQTDIDYWFLEFHFGSNSFLFSNSSPFVHTFELVEPSASMDFWISVIDDPVVSNVVIGPAVTT